MTVNTDTPVGTRFRDNAGFSRDAALSEEIGKNEAYVDRIAMSILQKESIKREKAASHS